MFFVRSYTFIKQGCIILIKRDSKDIYNINAVLFKSICIKKILKIHLCFHLNINFFSTFLIKRNISELTNQYIRMISEGSCDIEEFEL